MPSSESLFSGLSYALFAAPGAVVVSWMLWRAMAWCLFHTAVVSAWLGTQSAVVQIPIAIGLLLLAWPLLVLALLAWILIRIFPAFAIHPGRAPRLFAPSKSRALSSIFVFFLAMPLAFVPLRYVAYQLEGSQIGVWHWLLVFGSILLLLIWLIARLRRRQDEV